MMDARCGDGVVHVGEECDDGAGNSDTLPDACRSTCRRAKCGDGVKDSSEGCDNGAENSDSTPDACSTQCAMAACGNTVVDSGEECDQGASNSNTQADACRTSCKRAKCGDGVIDGGETCDEGAQNSDTTFNACRTNCQLPHCGDDVIDPGEACDDGAKNGASGDNCSSACKLASCGNGVIQAPEQCDNGAANSDSAANACRTSCQNARCGDAVVDTGEDCDQGAANSDTQPGACRRSCKKARCGDGAVDTGEECDGGANCTADCKAIRCGNSRVDSGEECDPPAAGSCDAACRKIACGNGRVDAGEECEPTGAANDPCTKGCKFSHCGDGKVDSNEQCEPEVTALCTSTCRLPVCGNSAVEPGETCDDGKNDGKYGGCSADCKSRAARCGDGQVQSANGEQCEPPGTASCDGSCHTPSCIPTGAEQCFNGIDDDCNGAADCADSACNSKATCVPNGSRIGILVASNTACPQGFTNGQQTLHQGISNGSCSGCGCSSGATQCSAGLYYYATAAACTADTANNAGTYTGQLGFTCPAAPQAEGTIAGFRATPMTVTPGACTPGGTASPSTPAWSSDVRLCVTGSAGAGCNSGFSCVPAAPQGTLCSEKSGSGSCPSNFNQQTWYEAYQDTRTCGACQCTSSGGDCSKVKVQVGSDWGCSDTLLMSAGERKCGQSIYSPPVRLTGTPTNPTCSPKSALSGALSATAAHAFCCK
jgi:cysteine-rich repeat protein